MQTVGGEVPVLDARPARRRRGYGIATAVAVALAAAVAAWWFARSGPSNGAIQASLAAQPPASSERNAVALPPEAKKANPIATARVSRMRLSVDLDVVGAATYDSDRFAVVGPLIHGRVVTLRARPGDDVTQGQVLAEIESAEVGQAEAAYLSAAARNVMSQANLKRERDLAAHNVSSAREREIAEAQAAADGADLRAAEQRLRAFGMTAADVKNVGEPGRRAGRVALRAPLGGTVVSRKISIGQAVEAATDCFHIADLDRLWVNLELFEKDLAIVHEAQKAELRTEAYPGEVLRARVAFIEPLVDPETRTANVRIEFANVGRKLRPGQFVTARLLGGGRDNAPEVLAVPRKAVVAVEGRSVVFVAEGGRWSRRTVELGRSGGELVEVRSGLQAGEQVVADGAFSSRASS